MNNKNKILLLFPDGVGIRNYLYSDVFDATKEDLVLFHNFDEATVAKISKITNISSSFKIPRYKETIIEKFLREIICLGRLKNNARITENKTILSSWKTNHKSVKNKVFYKLVTLFSCLFGNYKHILLAEKIYRKVIRKTSYYQEVRQIVTEIKPDLVFCSHQRGIQCATIFAAATDLNIKTKTVIYSWDNLPKARLALRADYYLVWSDYMKEEMKLYYPEINQNKVIVTGTPQFECYENKDNILPKEEFYRTYRLDTSKKIICFSGDDVLTSPDDPKYLNDLAEELIKNDLIEEYQILFRRCPVDVSDRYEKVVKKYPNIIKVAPPIWNFTPGSSWTTIYPLPEDVKLLVSTAFYCEVVVNLGSTMAFDFGMFQKPCIYINYDQTHKVNPIWSVNTIYQFQHFRSIADKKAVIWWTKKEQITTLLKEATYNPAMADWTQLILGNYQKASVNITNSLKK
jgi:hypothetical protein